MPGNFAPFEAKMRADGLSDAAVAAFKNAYDALTSGATGMIPESELTPASGVPKLVDVEAPAADAALLAKTVVLKLNGGLGTSMGLDYAKSLLKVKGADTFLDLTAKQIMQMRNDLQTNVKFVLMNSFATSADTMAFFKEKYPTLYADPNLEFVQNKVPKIRRDNFEPALWPTKPSVEWCPPGHGDLYAALLGSGTLDSMLAQGSKYLFVSNSDNLGATLDPKLLSYFAQSKAPFMMECCERTANDKKGGHLASREGQLILREAAQCPDEDEDAFQDISKHRYFNTNNLWIDLEALKAIMTAHGGVVPLPMIKNKKTVWSGVLSSRRRRRDVVPGSVSTAPRRSRRSERNAVTRHRCDPFASMASTRCHNHHNTGRPQGRFFHSSLPARDGHGRGHRVLQGCHGHRRAPHALRARQEVQRLVITEVGRVCLRQLRASPC